MTRYGVARWTEVRDEAAHVAALRLARGAYQRAILWGGEAVSGSTLRGKARTYGARYQRSTDALLERMTAAGIPWAIETREHGRRVLVIGK